MEPETGSQNAQLIKNAITAAASNEELRRLRRELAQLSSKMFLSAGTELSVLGNGSDERLAVSVLLRIASQLVSASADLFDDGRQYAAAALVRQMVEIEYLAWAMETRDGEGERWLRSTRQEREDFFTPAKLRKAAQGEFRAKDYGYHCELGGHPVPGANLLLKDDLAVSQLLLADLLGHVGRIWDHLIGWALKISGGEPILSRSREMSEKFAAWKAKDPMCELPPPT